ncbi:MAG: phosphate ABC transporter permease subunit PstC [Deltaproteobacteria bacterium]|nr:phosphate ABC transporter permease subunit PstC [Deltaproteobacteria bacterium]MBI3386715.1 phosphate ABC transporter permease subunit PstC [Deltaproteobacteria bacterium]
MANPSANPSNSPSVQLGWPLASTLTPQLRRRLNVGDLLFRGLTALFALVLIAIGGAIVAVLVYQSSESIQTFGWGFLVTSKWDPVFKEFGALPFIYGTIVSSFLALLQAVPLSIGTALFLSEMSPNWLRGPVSFLVELLATIPSVVYGLWGIFVLVPWVRTYVAPALSTTLGFLPFFQGPNYGVGMLTASIILAVMVIPYITSVAQEVFKAVPLPQREAALALGATKWEMVRLAVLPYGRTGLIGAIMLGLGRALGETMAVTMVIGNRADISLSLFAPGSTMASVIANEFSEATYELYVQALIEIGLVLLIVTVVVNICARLLVWSVAGPNAGTRGA